MVVAGGEKIGRICASVLYMVPSGHTLQHAVVIQHCNIDYIALVEAKLAFGLERG